MIFARYAVSSLVSLKLNIINESTVNTCTLIMFIAIKMLNLTMLNAELRKKIVLCTNYISSEADLLRHLVSKYIHIYTDLVTVLLTRMYHMYQFVFVMKSCIIQSIFLIFEIQIHFIIRKLYLSHSTMHCLNISLLKLGLSYFYVYTERVQLLSRMSSTCVLCMCTCVACT